MGFDEAQETVRILVVVPAPDPQLEAMVLDRDYPAPILCDWLKRLKAPLLQGQRTLNC